MAWTDKLAQFLRLNDGEQAYTGYPQMQVGLNKPRQAGYATGFLEGATGMESMQPKNPITDPNYDQYAQGKNTGEAAGIGAMAIPGYAMALRAGAPKAYNALENYMVKSGGMIPLEAYHGTPHKIEGAFDIKKMGTGEGAQAYGPGMYFAQAKPVAQEYANLGTGNVAYKGHTENVLNKLQQAGADYNTADLISTFAYEGGYKGGSSKDLIKFLKTFADTPEEIKLYKDLASKPEVVEAINFYVTPKQGNLYKVDIPDEYISTMLDWDKPLSQQPKHIQQIANARLDEIKAMGGQPPADPTGEWLYKALHPQGKESGVGNGPELAAKRLQEAGIKGIRYLDQGSRSTTGGELIGITKTPDGYVSKVKVENRGGAGFSTPTQQFTSSTPFKTEAEAKAWADNKIGKGTSNFVVFEPSTVKILEENGKPVSRKAILEEQVSKLKE